MSIRTAMFVLLVSIGIAASWRLLRDIISLSQKDGYGSYAALVPLFSGYMIWSRRHHVFSKIRYDLVPGLVAICVGLALQAVMLLRGFLTADSFEVLDLRFLVLLMWLGGAFLMLYGREALKEAIFPFALLPLTIPLPTLFVDRVIAALQSGSTTAAYFLFSLLGTPVYRDGFLLHVPGVTIEVAKECSGINSSIALVLTLLLVGYETLRMPSRRLILVLLAIPISFAKNAIRIVTLTLLAIHVDPRFLTGDLHHKGGIVFYLIGLAALYPIWKLMQRSEGRKIRLAELKRESAQLAIESARGVAASNT